MRRLAGTMGAAALLCALAPSAAASHSQYAECQWASSTLPQEEAVTVTLEGPRWFEDCPGWRVGVSAAGSDEVALQTYRDAEEPPSPPEDPGPDMDRRKKGAERRCASQAKSKKAKRRNGRSKCRRSKGRPRRR